MTYSFLYPGQGAQYPGMGRDLFDHSQAVRDLFAEADKHADFDVRRVLFEGAEEELKQTNVTQVAITLVNLAAARVLAEHGITADRFAGFSLGEYAALVDAGVLDAADVFPVVTTRGRLMEETSRTLDAEAGAAGMAAVLGLQFETVRDTIIRHGIENLYPAIYNSPVQTVVSGTAEALDAAESVFREAGAKRFIRLKVSGPFHCPLMREARERFAEFLAGVTFSDPRKPVYSNVTARPVSSGEDARRLCLDQLVSTVMWTAEERRMVADGADGFLEVGPGTVLGGLWKAYVKANPETDLQCHPAGTMETIGALATE
ncbi:MAG: ACP S-malonyltransferase [Spirochaetaceae bacterium]